MNNAVAFQAIVRKELRENMLWAALGLVLTYMVLISGLPNDLAQSYPDLISVFSITAIVAAVVGLMIGRAQGISENRGDPWSFLVHRPVSRATLFWGKAAAGVLLYLGAVAIPTISVAVWLATPGRVAAPFDWRMTLPAIVDMTCGVVFYFCGMLTALRDARWYATRALGIGVGFICATAVLTMIHTFWIAMAFCALGIVVAAVAARGTFMAGGHYAPQSRTSRLAVGIAIASGLAVVGFFVVLTTMELSSSYRISQQGQGRRYAISSDGVVVQLVVDNVGDILAVNDLQGNPIDKYKDAESRKAVQSGVVSAQATLNPLGSRDNSPPSDSGYRSSAEIYTKLESRNPLLRWYYIHDRGLIAAYDTTSKRIMGWLGPDGFSNGETLPANRFHGVTHSYREGGGLVAFPDAVYQVDLDNRRTSKVFAAPAGEVIVGAGRSSAEGFDVIATNQKIYVQSPDGTPRLSVPRDPKAEGYGVVQVLQAPQAPGAPMFVWYLAMGGSKFTYPQAYYQPQYVSQIRSDGSVVIQVEVPPYLLPNRSLRPYLADIVMMTLAMPVLLKASIYEVLPEAITPGLLLSGWLWPSMIGLAIAGIIFAKGRSNAFTPGQLLMWTFLGFGLGPLGLALMYSLIEWPAKENCPSCQRKRIVAREHCEHCHAGFPPPAPDGTEIFEAQKL